MRVERSTVIFVTLALTACVGEEQRPATPPGSAIETREVSYNAGETPLEGFMAWDGARQDRRPGVIVVHEWWGNNDHARQQARRLAQAGYVGFALDMYGSGKTTTHPDSAQSFVTETLENLGAMTTRFQAAVEQLKLDPHVDTTRIAAIGYCFGGAVVLGMAQDGLPLRAVASFHGSMPPAARIDSGSVQARMLVLTGAADPMVPLAQVDSFAMRLRRAGASIEVVSYPGVMHSFTNPNAGSFGMPGLQYDASADRQSWEAMLALFAAALR
ncbi:MAG: hypothetical protein MNPFHGCM_03033 [Gemmatimonadaceae bacterium]|nr:hypothetical protein [Gemmatimonadaceae bacterium]